MLASSSDSCSRVGFVLASKSGNCSDVGFVLAATSDSCSFVGIVLAKFKTRSVSLKSKGESLSLSKFKRRKRFPLELIAQTLQDVQNHLKPNKGAWLKRIPHIQIKEAYQIHLGPEAKGEGIVGRAT